MSEPEETFRHDQFSTHGGTVLLMEDGSFDYIPDDRFAGIDSFSFKVPDGMGGLREKTVTITVPARRARTVAIAIDELSLDGVHLEGCIRITNRSGPVDVQVLDIEVSVYSREPGQRGWVPVPLLRPTFDPGFGTVIRDELAIRFMACELMWEIPPRTTLMIVAQVKIFGNKKWFMSRVEKRIAG